MLSFKQVGCLLDKRCLLGAVVLLCDVKICKSALIHASWVFDKRCLLGAVVLLSEMKNVKVLSFKQVRCLFDKRCLLGAVVLLCDVKMCKSALIQAVWVSV